MARSMPIPEPPVGGQKKMVEKRKKKASSKGGGGGGSLFGPILDNSGLLAETIEKQANAQQRQAEANASPDFGGGDPIQNLMDQVMGQYNSINVAPTSYEKLKRLAEQQVGMQFDPMIALLKQQMGQHQNRAQRSMGEARSMYDALGADFISQLPELTQQYAAEDRETNSRYDGAQKVLQDQYKNQQNEQNAVLQQLGIQAAAPDASRQAQADQSYLQGQMESDQQSALDALKQQQTAQSDYTRNLGNSSRMAGENTAQGIAQQLNDYLGQADTQMAGLQGQRGSALSALIQQMQSQDAQRVQQEEQQQFQNLMSLSNFQLDAAKLMGQNAASGNESLFGDATSGLPGAQNFLAEKYPNSPIIASNLMEQLNDVMSNKQVVQGKYILDPGDPSTGKSPVYSDVGQQMMEDLLRREIEKENQSQPGRYNNMDINNAIAALQAIFGKVR